MVFMCVFYLKVSGSSKRVSLGAISIIDDSSCNARQVVSMGQNNKDILGIYYGFYVCIFFGEVSGSSKRVFSWSRLYHRKMKKWKIYSSIMLM
jgi:hypothetical protein